MADSYTESTTVGCGSRLMESIKGVGIGILLVGISVFVLFWNEGRAVHRQQALEEGAASVISVKAEQVDKANEGKLVHVAGDVKTATGLADEKFDIKAPNALRLRRKVEMYQWKEDEKTETKKNLGGSEERIKTYTYEKVWTESVIDSTQFKKPAGHENPGHVAYSSEIRDAVDARMGAFAVNAPVLGFLSPNNAVVPAGSGSVENSTPKNGSKAAYTVSNNMLYLGNTNSPTVGDVRIAFTEYPSGPVSVIARQVGETFQEFKAKTDTILLVQPGIVAADVMFKQAEDENKMMTWIIRVVGFLFIAIGFGLMFGPFVTMADVVPFIGSIVGAGTFIAAIVCAIPVWTVTVAIAWIFYRPVIGIALLVVALAVPILFMVMRSKKAVTAA